MGMLPRLYHLLWLSRVGLTVWTSLVPARHVIIYICTCILSSSRPRIVRTRAHARMHAVGRDVRHLALPAAGARGGVCAHKSVYALAQTGLALTACPLRGYGRAGTQNDPREIPVQWTCRPSQKNIGLKNPCSLLRRTRAEEGLMFMPESLPREDFCACLRVRARACVRACLRARACHTCVRVHVCACTHVVPYVRACVCLSVL